MSCPMLDQSQIWIAIECCGMQDLVGSKVSHHQLNHDRQLFYGSKLPFASSIKLSPAFFVDFRAWMNLVALQIYAVTHWIGSYSPSQLLCVHLALLGSYDSSLGCWSWSTSGGRDEAGWRNQWCNTHIRRGKKWSPHFPIAFPVCISIRPNPWAAAHGWVTLLSHFLCWIGSSQA